MILDRFNAYIMFFSQSQILLSCIIFVVSFNFSLLHWLWRVFSLIHIILKFHCTAFTKTYVGLWENGPFICLRSVLWNESDENSSLCCVVALLWEGGRLRLLPVGSPVAGGWLLRWLPYDLFMATLAMCLNVLELGSGSECTKKSEKRALPRPLCLSTGLIA